MFSKSFTLAENGCPKSWTAKEMICIYMISKSVPIQRTSKQSKTKLSNLVALRSEQSALNSYFKMIVAMRGQVGSIGVQLDPDPDLQQHIENTELGDFDQ